MYLIFSVLHKLCVNGWMSMLVFEEGVGSDSFCGRMWNKLFRW
jgi:hypothetical protein